MYTTCAEAKASQTILTSMTHNCHLIVCSANPAFTAFLPSSCCFSDAARPNKNGKKKITRRVSVATTRNDPSPTNPVVAYTFAFTAPQFLFQTPWC